MTEEQIQLLIKLYPDMTNKALAEKLSVPLSTMLKKAQKLQLKKSNEHHKYVMENLKLKRKDWFEQSIQDLFPSEIQEQLLYGSLLGDGYISRGAKRSRHFHYQEHFGENQRGYRQWKLSLLDDLNFNISGCFLRSSSHPFFNQLHSQIYDERNIKKVTSTFLTKCTSIYFLLALYLDDGSLIISKQINHKAKKIFLKPSIVLYTLNFTRSENILLKNHINKQFNQNFVLSQHPDGHKALLKLNKTKETLEFLQIFNSFTGQIPGMDYKLSLDVKEKPIKELLKKQYPDYEIIRSSSDRNKLYSSKEIALLKTLKKQGFTDKQIAQKLNRTYWSVVYKWADLKKE